MIYYIYQSEFGTYTTPAGEVVGLAECAAVYPAKGDTTEYYTADSQEQAVEHFGLAPYTRPEPPQEEPQVSLDEVSRPYLTAMDNMLADAAHGAGYDSVLSCISYIGSSNAIRAAQAVAMRDWRDACYDAATRLQEQYAAAATSGGELPTVEEFLAMLPAKPDNL